MELELKDKFDEKEVEENEKLGEIVVELSGCGACAMRVSFAEC